MMKLKTKRNGVYYLDVQIPDPATGALRRARVGLDTKDKADAEQQRRDWIAGIHPKHPAQGGVIAAKGRGPSPDPSTRSNVRQTGMTVIRWLEACLTTLWGEAKAQDTHRSNVKMLSGVIDDGLMLVEITGTHIVEIKRVLTEERKYAPASIKKLLGTLSAALAHAADPERGLNPATAQPWLATVPRFPKVRVDNIQDRTISHDEEVAVFECIDARIDAEPLRPWWEYKMLMTILLDTGFRLGEAMQLGPQSVKRKRWLDKATGRAMEAIYLTLPRYMTKSDKPREVPATRRVQGLIQALNSRVRGGRWFPWPEGSSGPWYMWSNVRDDMAARGFDVSDVKQHTFRHTCATRLADNGMDLLTLSQWLGHADIQITAKRYIHLCTTHLHVGAAILDTFNGSVSPLEEIEVEAGGYSTNRNLLSSGRDQATAGTVGAC